MPPRLRIAFLCSWKQLNSVLATWEVNRNTGWTGACAEQRLHQSRSRRVPSPGVTLLGSRAGSCSSACPCAALSETPLEASGCTLQVCLDCSRPQSQQKQIVSLWLRFLQPALGQECCLTSGTPTSCPQKWGMCVTVPLAALPRFQSDILLSCQTVMAFAAAELRFWNHLVFLGDGPEHLGPFCTF